MVQLLASETRSGRLLPLLSLLTLLAACGLATNAAPEPTGTAGSPPTDETVPSEAPPIVHACSEQDACRDCGSCFARCLCTGEKFAACQAECGNAPPPASCSTANACVGCASCFDRCVCSGGTYLACSEACAPVEADAGTPDAAPDPTQDPPPEPPPDGCTKDPAGLASSCAACTTCLASCTCAGTSIDSCLNTCGAHDCCNRPPDYCQGNGLTCTCSFSALQCFDNNCSAFSACDSCTCSSCPGEIGVCKTTYGCLEVFHCMRATGCRGSECIDRCWTGDPQQGYPAEAFSVAEALRACDKGNHCSGCAVPPPVSCPTAGGAVQCPSVQLGETTISACCTAPPGEPAGPGLTPDSNPCGLDYSSYPGSRGCEPREQASPPRSAQLETCPDASIPGIAYNHALLKGCCRAADHQCGYYDDITGLGCVSASVFGLDTRPCP